MNTKEVIREEISALADGELDGQQVDVALAALRQEQGLADWDLYHRIGDVLRSDDMAISLSPGFSARMAARLEAEPTIIAPACAGNSSGSASTQRQPEQSMAQDGDAAMRPMKRWAVPGMAAAAAMAAVTFVATPQLMVAMKGGGESADAPLLADGATQNATIAAVSGAEPAAVVTASVPEGVVLRDPRIDDYLLAHQRLSPSVYSTAQYARSATFATDSDK